MTDMLTYLGAELRRYYDAIVRVPMPWRMIDKLESLEDAAEQRDAEAPRGGDVDHAPARDGAKDRSAG